MVKGRKPNSIEVNRTSGSFVKNPQRENKQAPIGKAGFPEKPSHIESNVLASRYWDQTCYQLDEINLLAESDGSAIEIFVQAMAINQRLFLVGDVHNAQKQSELCLKLASELGLTPSARSRMVTVAPKDDDPLADFLSRRMGVVSN